MRKSTCFARLLLFIAGAAILGACTPEPPALRASPGRSATAGLRFRWSGCGPHASGCETPLGICLIIGIGRARPLSAEEVAADYGTAEFQVVGGDRLRMVFHRAAALADSTIPITQAKALEPDLSGELGYSQIVLQPGTYRVDFSRSRFGEILVPIQTQR